MGFKKFFGLTVASALCVLSFSSRANALIELKAGYSVLMSDPKEINNMAPLIQKFEDMAGISADLMISLPMMPIGIGARYEEFKFKKANAAGGHDASYQRVSVLMNKRFIDTVGYLGMIASVGVSNEFKDKLTIAGTPTELKTSGGVSGSIGIEAGVKLGFLLLGAEGGYLVAPIGKLKTASGGSVTNNGNEVKTDLSGVYARATLGLGF